ncbi:MAG: hypothetical protein A2W47_06725 [Gammaproteobacteria bacterium RIFCSPHIGHO2_12_38_15]|nr:MAG: hypothetical protein A2W47_06725 [Gammaproteobacteria bacterium RIFCSPHIGHO2_12_38_15]
MPPQEDRLMKVKSHLGDAVFLAVNFHAIERLFESFLIDLTVLSLEKNISSVDILQKSISIELNAENGRKRFFHGMVKSFEAGGQNGHFFNYRVEMVPQLWFLKSTKLYRIFEDMTVIDIIRQVLHEAQIVDFTFKLYESRKARDYCCQYGESTYAFIHRLMEEEGIFYFYAHHKTEHKIIFTDHTHYLEYVSAEELVFSRHKSTFRSKNFVLSDYQPCYSKEILCSSNTDEWGDAIHHYPGKMISEAEGEVKIKLHKMAEEADETYFQGSSENIFFSPGFQFQHHGKNYYLKEVKYDVCDGSYYSHGRQQRRVQFSCVSAEKYFKPSVKTPRPKALGIETAIVMGESGGLYVNNKGQVKVQFHWGKYNEKMKSNSCWLRVAQPWAGKQFGMQFLPRAGDEVIVQFIHGDPDRPIITACLSDPVGKPLFDSGGMSCRNGIKTRTVSQEAGAAGNELSFEDQAGKEEIFLYAQKDFKRVIHSNEHCEIKNGNFEVLVSKGKINLECQEQTNIKVGNHCIEINEKGLVLKGKKIIVQS